MWAARWVRPIAACADAASVVAEQPSTQQAGRVKRDPPGTRDLGCGSYGVPPVPLTIRSTKYSDRRLHICTESVRSTVASPPK